MVFSSLMIMIFYFKKAYKLRCTTFQSYRVDHFHRWYLHLAWMVSMTVSRRLSDTFCPLCMLIPIFGMLMTGALSLNFCLPITKSQWQLETQFAYKIIRLNQFRAAPADLFRNRFNSSEIMLLLTPRWTSEYTTSTIQIFSKDILCHFISLKRFILNSSNAQSTEKQQSNHNFNCNNVRMTWRTLQSPHWSNAHWSYRQRPKKLCDSNGEKRVSVYLYLYAVDRKRKKDKQLLSCHRSVPMAQISMHVVICIKKLSWSVNLIQIGVHDPTFSRCVYTQYTYTIQSYTHITIIIIIKIEHA